MESKKDSCGGPKSIVTPYFDLNCELIIEYITSSNERTFSFLLSDPDENDDYITILTHFYLQMMVLLSRWKDPSKEKYSKSLPIVFIEKDIKRRAEIARSCIKENNNRVVSEIIFLKLRFRGFQKKIAKQMFIDNNTIVPDEFQLSVKKAFFDILS